MSYVGTREVNWVVQNSGQVHQQYYQRMNAAGEGIWEGSKTETPQVNSGRRRGMPRSIRFIDEVQQATSPKETTPNKRQLQLQYIKVSNRCPSDNYKRGRDSLQDLTKKVLQYLLTSEGNKLNRTGLMRLIGVKRRKMYDVLTISASLRIITQINPNQYQLAANQRLLELIKCITHKKGNQCNDQHQTGGTSTQGSRVGGCSQLFKLTLSVLKVLLEVGTMVTIQQINQNVGPYFTSVTRIKRIYDVANVLCAYGLVRKTKSVSKIIGYQWIGVDDFLNLVSHPQLDDRPQKSSCDEGHTLEPQKSKTQLRMPQIPSLPLHFDSNPNPFVYFAVNRLDMMKLLQQPSVNQPMWHAIPVFSQAIHTETTPTKQQGFHRVQYHNTS